MFQTRASEALWNHTKRRDTERSCSWGLGRHLWVRDERESSRMISGPGSGEQEIVWHSSSSREREEEAAMASTTSAASLVRLWAPPKTFSPSAASSSPSTSYSPSLSGSNSAFFASEMLLSLRCSQAIAQQQQREQQQQKQRQRRQTGPVSIRAETTKAKGLSVEQGGRWLSSTTRHVRIFAGYIDPVTDVMDQSQLDKLTLMLDPDDEFLWPEDKVQAVYAYFKELVDHYAVRRSFCSLATRFPSSGFLHMLQFSKQMLQFLDSELCRILFWPASKQVSELQCPFWVEELFWTRHTYGALGMENCSNQYFSFSLTFWEDLVHICFFVGWEKLDFIGFCSFFSYFAGAWIAACLLGFGAYLLCLLVGESLTSLGFLLFFLTFC
jgi:hypothetical protein